MPPQQINTTPIRRGIGCRRLFRIVSMMGLVIPFCNSLGFNSNQKGESNNNSNNNNSNNSVSYGVDVSFPMHHASVSTNYPWLPHNVQPENYPTPPEYEGMPIQPLGNREAFYRDMILGCIIHYGVEGGKKCIGNEEYRIEMSLRQPQSMVNYTELVRQWALSIWLAFFFFAVRQR